MFEILFSSSVYIGVVNVNAWYPSSPGTLGKTSIVKESTSSAALVKRAADVLFHAAEAGLIATSASFDYFHHEFP